MSACRACPAPVAIILSTLRFGRVRMTSDWDPDTQKAAATTRHVRHMQQRRGLKRGDLLYSQLATLATIHAPALPPTGPVASCGDWQNANSPQIHQGFQRCGECGGCGDRKNDGHSGRTGPSRCILMVDCSRKVRPPRPPAVTSTRPPGRRETKNRQGGGHRRRFKRE